MSSSPKEIARKTLSDREPEAKGKVPIARGHVEFLSMHLIHINDGPTLPGYKEDISYQSFHYRCEHTAIFIRVGVDFTNRRDSIQATAETQKTRYGYWAVESYSEWC